MAAESWTRLSHLIDRARNGKTDVLASLLQNYRSYLALLARLQISRQLQGRVSPSDVVQDTFLWAKRAFPEFRGSTEGELTAWLRKILASQLAIVARHHRAKRRDVRLEQQFHQDLDQSSLTLGGALPSDVSSPS
jgi:RNA polymerase sigma-70 factor (ECF subfamily)